MTPGTPLFQFLVFLSLLTFWSQASSCLRGSLIKKERRCKFGCNSPKLGPDFLNRLRGHQRIAGVPKASMSLRSLGEKKLRKKPASCGLWLSRATLDWIHWKVAQLRQTKWLHILTGQNIHQISYHWRFSFIFLSSLSWGKPNWGSTQSYGAPTVVIWSFLI